MNMAEKVTQAAATTISKLQAEVATIQNDATNLRTHIRNQRAEVARLEKLCEQRTIGNADLRAKLKRCAAACDHWEKTTVLISVRNCARAIRAALGEGD